MSERTTHRGLRGPWGQAAAFNEVRVVNDHKEDGFEAGSDSRTDGVAEREADF